jgi:xanthine dehydrogenase accessory factor
LLLGDAPPEGSLGDPALDAAADREARALMAKGASRTLTLEGVRCFVEVYGPSPTLLIVGAGHVAMPLVTLARTLGFQTTVIDGRPSFANRERFPHVDSLLVGIPSELVKQTLLTPATALILVAHDYKYDIPVLRHALGTDVEYIGMLGSRRRGETILKMLREEGLTEEQLKRVHVPIGLDLGGETASEIALAIMAEVVASRHEGSGRPLSQIKRG